MKTNDIPRIHKVAHGGVNACMARQMLAENPALSGVYTTTTLITPHVLSSHLESYLFDKEESPDEHTL